MSIGLRIKSARTAAGLSQRGLAQKAALSHNQIAKYERGEDLPGSDALLRVADALNTNTDFFFREASVTLGAPCWRKKASLGVRKQRELLARVEDWLERYMELEALVEPWKLDAVEFQRPGDLPLTVSTGDDAESAAELLRQEWELGLDPIDNVAELLESRGIKVWALSEADGFDGCSLVANDVVRVIVINDAFPADRQRFSLLHELGHLLFEVPEGQEGERIMHRFAGAMLFPEVMVIRELSGKRKRLDIGTLHLLKHRYGLSMQAIAARARAVDVITEGYYASLCAAFRRNGWWTQEPGDQYLQGAKATRFERLVLTALAEDVISRSRAAELLGQPFEAFIEQFGVEHEGLQVGACC